MDLRVETKLIIPKPLVINDKMISIGDLLHGLFYPLEHFIYQFHISQETGTIYIYFNTKEITINNDPYIVRVLTYYYASKIIDKYSLSGFMRPLLVIYVPDIQHKIIVIEALLNCLNNTVIISLINTEGYKFVIRRGDKIFGSYTNYNMFYLTSNITVNDMKVGRTFHLALSQTSTFPEITLEIKNLIDFGFNVVRINDRIMEIIASSTDKHNNIFRFSDIDDFTISVPIINAKRIEILRHIFGHRCSVIQHTMPITEFGEIYLSIPY